MRAAQAFAARAVARVLRGRTLDAALARKPESASDDHALAQELSYGTLRHLGRLRATVALLVTRPPDDLELEALLCVALYQLQHGRATPHSVVSNAVDAAHLLKLTSAKSLVNAVLRKYLREREPVDVQAMSSDEARWSYPHWWIDRLRADWPDDWQHIVDAGNERPPLTLRVNRRRSSRDDMLGVFRDASITCRPIGDDGVIVDEPRNVHALPGFDDGWLSVQDHGAQVAAPLLRADDGMRVLDACAAPGGKTTHILERSDCDVVALERDPQRLQRVGDNLQRLGLSATTIEADAAAIDAWWNGTPFDRILADVPCTASGVVRRHPDGKWLRRASDIDSFAQQQRRIIDATWPVLKPGGRLLYTTCSVFAAENDAQVDAFVARHADAVRLPLEPHMPAAVSLHGPGQLLPVARGAEENHDGFFYALVEKRGG